MFENYLFTKYIVPPKTGFTYKGSDWLWSREFEARKNESIFFSTEAPYTIADKLNSKRTFCNEKASLIQIKNSNKSYTLGYTYQKFTAVQ